MPVEFPDLSRTRCHYLTVCGRVSGESPLEVPASFAPGEKWHVAEYEGSGAKVLVRCGWSPSADGRPAHLHFDFTTAQHFERRGRAVEVTVALEEVSRLVEAVSGREYKASFRGYYGVSTDQLPEPVRSLVAAARVEDGDVRAELTAGTLSITGKEPITAVRWEKDEHPAGYELMLTGRMAPVASGQMLTEAALAADKWFTTLCSPGDEV